MAFQKTMQTADEVRKLLENLKKSFQCTICLDLLSQPVSTKCNHQFCSKCFDELLQNKRKGKNGKCPLCNATVTKRSLHTNTNMVGMVSSVRDLCNAADDDCSVLDVTPLLSQRYKTPNEYKKKKSVNKTSLVFTTTKKSLEMAGCSSKDFSVQSKVTQQIDDDESVTKKTGSEKDTQPSSSKTLKTHKFQSDKKPISNDVIVIPDKGKHQKETNESKHFAKKNTKTLKSLNPEVDDDLIESSISTKKNSRRSKSFSPEVNAKRNLKQTKAISPEVDSEIIESSISKRDLKKTKTMSPEVRDELIQPSVSTRKDLMKKNSLRSKNVSLEVGDAIIKSSISTKQDSSKKDLKQTKTDSSELSDEIIESSISTNQTLTKKNAKRTKTVIPEIDDKVIQPLISTKQTLTKSNSTSSKSFVQEVNEDKIECEIFRKHDSTSEKNVKPSTKPSKQNIKKKDLRQTKTYCPKVNDEIIQPSMSSEGSSEFVLLPHAHKNLMKNGSQIKRDRHLASGTKPNELESENDKGSKKPDQLESEHGEMLDSPIRRKSTISTETKSDLDSEKNIFRRDKISSAVNKSKPLISHKDELAEKLYQDAPKDTNVNIQYPTNSEDVVPDSQFKHPQKNCKHKHTEEIILLPQSSCADVIDSSFSDDIPLTPSTGDSIDQIEFLWKSYTSPDKDHVLFSNPSFSRRSMDSINKQQPIRLMSSFSDTNRKQPITKAKEQVTKVNEPIADVPSPRNVTLSVNEKVNSPENENAASSENENAASPVKENTTSRGISLYSQDSIIPPTPPAPKKIKTSMHISSTSFNKSTKLKNRFSASTDVQEVGNIGTSQRINVPDKAKTSVDSSTSLNKSAKLSRKSTQSDAKQVNVIEKSPKRPDLKKTKSSLLSPTSDAEEVNVIEKSPVPKKTKTSTGGSASFKKSTKLTNKIIQSSEVTEVNKTEKSPRNKLYSSKEIETIPDDFDVEPIEVFTNEHRKQDDGDIEDDENDQVDEIMFVEGNVPPDDKRNDEIDSSIVLNSQDNNDVITGRNVKSSKLELRRNVSNDLVEIGSSIGGGELNDELPTVERKKKKISSDEDIEDIGSSIGGVDFELNNNTNSNMKTNKFGNLLDDDIGSSIDIESSQRVRNSAQNLIRIDSSFNLDQEDDEPKDNVPQKSKGSVDRCAIRDPPSEELFLSDIEMEEALPTEEEKEASPPPPPIRKRKQRIADSSSDESDKGGQNQAVKSPLRKKKVSNEPIISYSVKFSGSESDDEDDDEMLPRAPFKIKTKSDQIDKVSSIEQDVCTKESFITPGQRYQQSKSSMDTSTGKHDVSNDFSTRKHDVSNEFSTRKHDVSKNTSPRKHDVSNDTPQRKHHVSNEEIEEWKSKLRSPIENDEPVKSAVKHSFQYSATKKNHPSKTMVTPGKSNLLKMKDTGSLLSPHNPKASHIPTPGKSILKTKDAGSSLFSPRTPKCPPIPVSQSTLLQNRQKSSSAQKPMLEKVTSRSSLPSAGKHALTENSLQLKSNKIEDSPSVMANSPQTTTFTPVIMTTRVSKRIMGGRLFEKGGNLRMGVTREWIQQFFSLKMIQCRNIISKLGGRYSNEFSSEATHLVVETDENNSLAKAGYTFKYLMALVSGIWIVNYKWLFASYKAKQFAREVDFEAKGDPEFDQEDIPRKYRQSLKRTSKTLFTGYCLCLLGRFSNSQISKAQLIHLLRKTNAELIYSPSEMVCSSSQMTPLLIADGFDDLTKEEKEVAADHGSTICHPDWVVESIINFQVQDTRNHTMACG